MQSNTHLTHWLINRGIIPTVLDQFNVTEYNHPDIGMCIRIPISPTHAKYRRDPQDPRKPKYLYDIGGKVTLYGYDQLRYECNNVVITEGELDTLVLWSHNIQAVSSTGGAMSWQESWNEGIRQMCHNTIYIALDNDDTGARGTVKILKTLPHAKIILIPELPDVKDISDYVSRGGDFRALMDSALPNDPQVIEADASKRKGQFLSTRFHQIYLDEHYQDLHKTTHQPSTYKGNDEVLKAKSYPCTKLLDFKKNKALCPFHNENTPSFTYYPKTNSCYCFGSCGRAYDAINLYRNQHPNASFKEAVAALNKLL